MTIRIASGVGVLVPLLLFVFVTTAPGQVPWPTPKNISISADSANPGFSTLVDTRSDGTFEAKGQIISFTQTETRLTVEMVTGSFTWALEGRPPSTNAFRTLRLTFENPRGNMIGFRASYDH